MSISNYFYAAPCPHRLSNAQLFNFHKRTSKQQHTLVSIVLLSVMYYTLENWLIIRSYTIMQYVLIIICVLLSITKLLARTEFVHAAV